jgi:hypothetical protein
LTHDWSGPQAHPIIERLSPTTWILFSRIARARNE